MTKPDIHPVQASILRALLFTKAANFSELQSGTTLTSDHFTFHITQLVQAGLVQKQLPGSYALTATGKELANKLQANAELVQQPKVSVLINAERVKNGQRQFLVQRRTKHPHYGMYGRISGKVKAGESFADAAKRTLQKETGLSADCTFESVYRKSDYNQASGALLEDKLFIVMQASNIQGQLLTQHRGGQNIWMSPADFLKLDPQICFASARTFMASPDNEQSGREVTATYTKEQY